MCVSKLTTSCTSVCGVLTRQIGFKFCNFCQERKKNHLNNNSERNRCRISLKKKSYLHYIYVWIQYVPHELSGSNNSIMTGGLTLVPLVRRRSLMETLWVESEVPGTRPVFPPSSLFSLLASVSMAKALTLTAPPPPPPRCCCCSDALQGQSQSRVTIRFEFA